MIAEYERGLGKNYLILERDLNVKDTYIEAMILKAKIPGVLSSELRFFNNTEKQYFDINSMISLSEYYREREIAAKDLLEIFTCISKIINQLTDYLISGEYLILSEEFIFINVEDKTVKFCLYTGNNRSLEEGFMGLGMFLINRINHDNEEIVKVVYDYFEDINNGNYNPKKYIDILLGEISKASVIEVKEINHRVEEEVYYFTEPDKEEIIDDNRDLLLPILICAAIILIACGGYSFVFLNPKILKWMGITQDMYIVFGAGMAFFVSVIMYFIIRIHMKKVEKMEMEIEAIEEEKYQQRMNPGVMEKQEYEIRNKKNSLN